MPSLFVTWLGEVVAYAGRTISKPTESSPKYKLPPGFRKSQEVFNLHRAIKEERDKPLVIVEGFFGCMRLHELGIKKAVALMGSTLSAFQESVIVNNTNHESRVIVLFDEDEAGKAGREDIAVRLSKSVFLKVHTFAKAGTQPEDLTEEEIIEIFD